MSSTENTVPMSEGIVSQIISDWWATLGIVAYVALGIFGLLNLLRSGFSRNERQGQDNTENKRTTVPGQPGGTEAVGIASNDTVLGRPSTNPFLSGPTTSTPMANQRPTYPPPVSPINPFALLPPASALPAPNMTFEPAATAQESKIRFKKGLICHQCSAEGHPRRLCPYQSVA